MSFISFIVSIRSKVGANSLASIIIWIWTKKKRMSQAKITKGFAIKHCHAVVRRSFLCMYCRHISCVGVKKLEFQLSHQSKSDPQDWNIRHPHDFNTDWHNHNKNVLRYTKLNNLIDLPKIFNRFSVVVLRSLDTRSSLPTLSSDDSEHHCLHRGREKLPKTKKKQDTNNSIVWASDSIHVRQGTAKMMRKMIWLELNNVGVRVCDNRLCSSYCTYVMFALRHPRK